MSCICNMEHRATIFALLFLLAYVRIYGRCLRCILCNGIVLEDLLWLFAVPAIIIIPVAYLCIENPSVSCANQVAELPCDWNSALR